MFTSVTRRLSISTQHNTAWSVKVPLLTSSLTTSAAFLPIFLAESTTGEFTAPIFKVVTIALLISWLLAITMIPLFSMLFLKAGPKVESEANMMQRIEERYTRILTAMLNQRLITLGAVLAVFFVALFSFRFIPNIFFPPSEDPTFKIELELPIGTPIARTAAVAAQVHAAGAAEHPA